MTTVGVPREIKPFESRVGLTPAGVLALRRAGHRVLLEAGAGQGSGFSDDLYLEAGAEVLASAEEIYGAAEVIVKVKEPSRDECRLLRPNQVLFAYLHLAPVPWLTRQLVEQGAVAIAYETVQLGDRSLPLLTPMSEVAGRMSVQIGAHFLERAQGGKGVLLGGVPGVQPAHVVILGGGVVGTNAAKMALGLGAQVTIFDISAERLRYLDDIFGGRLTTSMSNEYTLAEALQRADLLIGAVLVPGARTPQLVSEAMVAAMGDGSVIVDVAVDQGGSIATIDRVTTHAEPTYVKHGVIHYAVANMPGSVPRTSTIALTNVTLPYLLQLANKGWQRAMAENQALAAGANVALGRVVHPAVAEASGDPFTEVNQFF